ncbi:MAG TPA: hypothetical protein DIS79_03250, partial [Bacteroidetes bacterium]|nr:hypothetical protein [Bacteroidota bacterium]
MTSNRISYVLYWTVCNLFISLMSVTAARSQSSSVLPVPDGADARWMVMFDTGEGVFLDDTGSAYVTQNEWLTWERVVPPNVDSNFVFVPRDIDTAGNGNVFIVGLLWKRGNWSYDSTLTYAIKSTDRGRTWVEIGERDIGRWNSISFGSDTTGVALRELYSPLSRIVSARCVLIHDLQFDSVTLGYEYGQQRTFNGACVTSNNRYPQNPAHVAHIDDSTVVITGFSPCLIHSEFSSSGMWMYTLVSRDYGRQFFRSDGASNANEVYRDMKPPYVKARKYNYHTWSGTVFPQAYRSTRDAGQTWRTHELRWSYEQRDVVTTIGNHSLYPLGNNLILIMDFVTNDGVETMRFLRFNMRSQLTDRLTVDNVWEYDSRHYYRFRWLTAYDQGRKGIVGIDKYTPFGEYRLEGRDFLIVHFDEPTNSHEDTVTNDPIVSRRENVVEIIAKNKGIEDAAVYTLLGQRVSTILHSEREKVYTLETFDVGNLPLIINV